MNTVPELRAALVRAAATAPRRSALPRAVLAPMAAAAAAVVAALAVASLEAADPERPADPPPPAAPPAGKTLTCASGYPIHRDSLGGNWRARAVRIGPVTFLGLAGLAQTSAWRFAEAREHARHLPDDEMTEQLLENGPDRYAGVGLNVLVAPERTVTIALDPADRERAGLLTSLPTFGGFLPEDGDTAIRIEGCPPLTPEVRADPDVPDSAFGLAFVVAGARCLPITVHEAGAAPVRRTVSFGAGRCP